MEEFNKSCDQCANKKRKCPGGKPGKPCSRCVNSMAPSCTYSKRRPRTPSSQVAAMRRLRGTAVCSPLEQQHAKPSLKRCRWSASPATGLVGWQENTFLSDFFGSAGFMPLATQSGIRETMVRIMMSPSPQRPRRAREGYGAEEKLDGSNSLNSLFGGDGDGDGDRGRALVGGQPPVDPSTCTFWCAVGIGALVKGRPIESVANYAWLARAAIESFSGPANPEMAKAWSVLAYLHGFMGDQNMFHGYLALCDSFLRDKGASDELPVGFAEIIQVGKTIKLFAEDIPPEERESILAQELSRPKLGDLAGEGEICRCVWQSARIFEQAIGAGIFAPRASSVGSEDSGERKLGDAGGRAPGGDLGWDESLEICPVPLPPRPSELSPDCMASKKVEIMADLLQFRLLEEVAEIPSIKDGIGGLIINDHLLFEKVAKGDALGALERVARCIEVYERYPGLCRFKLGTHKAHIMIGILAAMDTPRSQQLYARLRAAYNLTRPGGAEQIPPLEEWRGVSSFCGRATCMSAETCGKMAIASSHQDVTVIEQDDADGAGSNKDQHYLTESAEFAQQGAANWPLAGVDSSPSGVGRAMSVEPEVVSSDQDTLCGGSDVRVNSENEPFSDVAEQGAGAFLLSKGDLGDEPEKDAVAAEDWLEVTHAMMDSSGPHGALG